MKWFFFTLTLLSTPVVSQALNVTLSSKVRFLTSATDTFDDWPCFSPDGKSVLFSRSMDGGKTWELFVVPASGGEAKRFLKSPLPVPVSATRAAWSSTEVIAFTGVTADGTGNLWLADSQGVQASPFEPAIPSRQVYYPSWYPDGRSLVVMDASDLVLKRINTQSGEVETFTDRNRIFTGRPSVSADGKLIAFAGQLNAGQTYDQSKNSIWLIEKSGEPRLLEHDTMQGRSPAWSPDGKRIVFESNRANNRAYALYVTGVNGTSAKQITDYKFNATHPAWSPARDEIVFSGRHDGNNSLTSIAVINVP
jgi:Tol biopolymer transport system component